MRIVPNPSYSVQSALKSRNEGSNVLITRMHEFVFSGIEALFKFRRSQRRFFQVFSRCAALEVTLIHLPCIGCTYSTSISQGSIVDAAVRIESLTSLDLSSNKVDQSALALRTYVASSR